MNLSKSIFPKFHLHFDILLIFYKISGKTMAIFFCCFCIVKLWEAAFRLFLKKVALKITKMSHKNVSKEITVNELKIYFLHKKRQQMDSSTKETIF